MFKNKPNKICKTIDGESFWSSRSVAVVGLIIVYYGFNYYILLTKRSAEMADEPGKWCLPCGYLDWNETLEEALEREIWEETGLNIKESCSRGYYPAFNINSDPKTNRQNISIAYAIIYDVLKLPILTKTSEVSELVWALLDKDLTFINKDLAFNHYNLIEKIVEKAEID